MNRQIATIACILFIVLLLRVVRESGARSSIALWIPTLWLAIGSSRNLSEWLQVSATVDSGDRYLEGNPIDRAVLTALMLLGIVVLARRPAKAKEFFARNTPIVLYFVYCLLSAAWSDFPDVALKRWFRAAGDIVMLQIIFSETNWVAAMKRVLLRVGFTLVPLSVLFIWYYPELGRAYSRWTGAASWRGVGSDKNALGLLCMVFGLAASYQVLSLVKVRLGNQSRVPLAGYAMFFLLNSWLLFKSNSATALACWLLGGGAMVLSSSRIGMRRPALIHSYMAGMVLVVVGAVFLNTGTGLIETLGRDSTITGRSEIWSLVLGMTVNPILGAGYESFWLGERLARIWEVYYNHPNQAHNGYIEIYLNLGWMGVLLLCHIFVTGYMRICASARRSTGAGPLRLAYFAAALLYNVSEGGFKMMHPLWLMLLWSVSAGPSSARGGGGQSTPKPASSSWSKLLEAGESSPAAMNTSGTAAWEG